jgi:two-component system, LuxR family, sensor kinase FixL
MFMEYGRETGHAEALVSGDSRLGAVDAVSVKNNDLHMLGAALAHEMNQPLTAMYIYLETLVKVVGPNSLGVSPLGDHASDLATKALKEAQRAIAIMRKMRHSTVTSNLERNPVDLKSVVIDTIEALRSQFLEKIDVQTHFEQDMPLILGDAVQVRQVIVNLLRNASDALGGHDDPQICVLVSTSDGFADIVVSDNGNGVSEQLAGRLFNAFATTKQHGIGLGLAISRMIAQNHGGDLELVNPGDHRGARFKFRLPAKTIRNESDLRMRGN